MSESQNVAVVQQAYAAFGRGDIPSVLARLNQNVDWEALVGAGSQVPTGGRRVGQAKVAEFCSTLGANIEFQVFDPKEFIAQGDKVVALGHYEGTAKPTAGALSPTGRWSSRCATARWSTSANTPIRRA